MSRYAMTGLEALASGDSASSQSKASWMSAGPAQSSQRCSTRRFLIAEITFLIGSLFPATMADSPLRIP
jgi:hypothetical protein